MAVPDEPPHGARVPLQSRWRRSLGIAVLLAASCFGAYWGWLGWDHTYQRDPTTGVASGPYETWQVAGCVLTLACVALGAGATRHAGAAIGVMPLAFTVAWSIPASSDETGLWGVGAFLLFVGCLLGTVVLAGGSAAVTGRRRT